MSKRELQYAFLWACVIVLVTCVPYFLVWWTAPRDGVFPGLLWNSDDQAAYFAWMRQAADGRLLFRNLFTTEPQRGVYFHLYFLLLGQLARLPGIDIPLAYHLGRVGSGIVTLVLVYRLGALVTGDLFPRRCIFWVTALSGGLGWLFWADQVLYNEPADVWQPEALTFPSLYANGLFAVSLALMLGVVICLLLAEERGPRWAVLAGICGLILGNVHSYDVIHLTVVWVAYLLGRWAVSGRFPLRELGYAALAAVIAAPSVAYMAWFYLVEPYFKARADTATLSPDPLLYVWGYGILIPLALWGGVLRAGEKGEEAGEGEEGRGESALARWAVAVGVTVVAVGVSVLLYRAADGDLGVFLPLAPVGPWLLVLAALRRRTRVGSRSSSGASSTAVPNPQSSSLAILAWAVVGLAAAYLPFAFQRKMVMGYHLPLGVLAGLGLADLSRRAAGRISVPHTASITAGLVVAFLSVTSVRYMVRDVHVAYTKGTTSTGIHPVYWPEEQVQAWEWMHENTPPAARLLAYPISSVMAPAYSGRTVYAGHWAETPRFQDRVRGAVALYQGHWDSKTRRMLLQAHGITHILIGPQERQLIRQGQQLIRQGQAQLNTTPLEEEPFLRPVFREGETVLYEVTGS